jgi:hypothetical protein
MKKIFIIAFMLVTMVSFGQATGKGKPEEKPGVEAPKGGRENPAMFRGVPPGPVSPSPSAPASSVEQQRGVKPVAATQPAEAPKKKKKKG